MLLYKPFDAEGALLYARRWALARNPLFYDFSELGGDCTSFVSQCILAGSCVMNFTREFGWYYISAADRAPAFTGVEPFWRFMTGDAEFRAANGGVGPFGEEIAREVARAGDVVQLGRETGEYYHTLLVTGERDGELLLTAHTRDVYDRPLSAYTAPRARFLRIVGVALEMPLASCLDALIEGRALPQ